LIATDLFGAQPDFSELASLCAAAGKPMIIDAAISFPARRSPPVGASEIVSLHHTKPWGYGEGGCAVVDTALADDICAFLNFGGTVSAFSEFAGNGKMSEIAAAFILQRLESMEHWAGGYRSQRQRITELALSEGLSLLVRPDPDVVAPHVPVLARGPVTSSNVPPAPFAVAKYYRPLGPGGNAAGLYARVVNIPCHSGMARIDDATLRRFLRALPGEYERSMRQ
jgi:dTDP-4-amino-4,6-dideoxygalactose transaminase